MGLSISSVMPTIAVDDLDRAIRFYSDTLGLSVRRLEGDMDSALVEVGDSDRLLLYKSTYRRGETTYASFFVRGRGGHGARAARQGRHLRGVRLPGPQDGERHRHDRATSRPPGSRTARATSSRSPTRSPRSCARPPDRGRGAAREEAAGAPGRRPRRLRRASATARPPARTRGRSGRRARPSAPRVSDSSSVSTMTASSPSLPRPTDMWPMLTPHSPSSVPTLPPMPGAST